MHYYILLYLNNQQFFTLLYMCFISYIKCAKSNIWNIVILYFDWTCRITWLAFLRSEWIKKFLNNTYKYSISAADLKSMIFISWLYCSRETSINKLAQWFSRFWHGQIFCTAYNQFSPNQQSLHLLVPCKYLSDLSIKCLFINISQVWVWQNGPYRANLIFAH